MRAKSTSLFHSPTRARKTSKRIRSKRKFPKAKNPISSELKAIIEKELAKVKKTPRKEKPKKKKTIDDITKEVKLKKEQKEPKMDFSYKMEAMYNKLMQQLDYSTLFGYLGNMTTNTKMYGTYAEVGNEIKTVWKDDMDYEVIEKVIRNTKMANMIGCQSMDGCVSYSVTPDVDINQREKWNFLKKLSFNWAMSTAMYSMIS